MPIPTLSSKTRSPRTWRRSRHGLPPRRMRIKKPERRKKGMRRVLPPVIGIAFVLLFIGSIVGIAVFARITSELPDPNRIIHRQLPLSTRIYDRSGEHLLYEVHGDEKRTLIRLEDLPDIVKKATLVIEDKNFYSHAGFDLRGILRALIMNVLRMGKVQGGSTITQQFIKNAILSSEKTYTRKIKELLLAYEFERRFTKDQILQLYLNEIPYGSTIYGIDAAAQSFLGKSARDLTIAEAAFLAALPKAPTYYSPYGSHQDALWARQQHIIDLLVEDGTITAEEGEKAKKEKVVLRPKRENIDAPHFVFQVREMLVERYGERMLEYGGLSVTTTIDYEKQKAAEKIIQEWGEKNEKNWKATNAALVAVNAKTGEVITLVGSRDYFDEKNDGQVNVAIRPRQPGSSFKPIVYTAAFKQGYTPETIVWDVETKFPTQIEGEYTPKNYDEKERGPVPIRSALAGSLNIPAVKAIYLAGIANVLDLADALGYTTLHDRSRFGLSLVLGGGEVKLLEHTLAFAVFAREGVRHDPVLILKIEDKDGNVLEEWNEEAAEAGKGVLAPDIAQRINSILSDNAARAFVFGTKNYLTLPDRPVAAKTGTTNDYRDAWTVGYTPSFAVGVWVGNNNNKAMKRGADGSKIAAPIWQAFMKVLTKNTKKEKFTPPPPETSLKPVLRGEIPEHSILHYVSKENPDGPEPVNPSDDPMYEAWEEGIRSWRERQEAANPQPPEESSTTSAPSVSNP